MKPDTLKRLEAAYNHVVEVAQHLDVSEHTCGTCKAIRKTNWTETMAKEALDGAATRIKRAMLSLSAQQRGGPDKFGWGPGDVEVQDDSGATDPQGGKHG